MFSKYKNSRNLLALLVVLGLTASTYCNVSCGGKTCGNTGDLCCATSRSGEVCYDPSGFTCVGGSVLCGKGLSACGETCYNSDNYQCCDPKRSTICTIGDPRCASSCPTDPPTSTPPPSYPPPPQPPPPTGTGNCATTLCPAGDQCCETLYGPRCYNPTNNTCCPSFQICGYQEGLPDKCCGMVCYDPRFYMCCNAAVGSICGIGDALCTSKCGIVPPPPPPPPQTPPPPPPSLCGPVQCCKDWDCCYDDYFGPLCIDPEVHTCCGGSSLCKQNEECCGDKCYNPDKYVCCNNGALLCGRNNKKCLARCEFGAGPNCDNAYANPSYFDKDKLNNKKFYEVTIDGLECDSYTIDSIYSDEPGKTSSGDPCPDGKGVGTDVAYVRAQALAIGKQGNGRVYTIGFTAYKDDISCSGYVTVGMGCKDCVDDGANFDTEDCEIYKDW